jgi:hypothetical protein
MCVSHGLDPRFFSKEQILEYEIAAFEEWVNRAKDHTGSMWPSRPTTKRLYPVITAEGATDAWWGQLKDGKPAPWPLGGANPRVESFLKSSPARRALVPVSWFFEMQDSDRSQWWRYQGPDDLLFLAATVQRGQLVTGEWFDCYSVITQDPPPQLAAVHKRTVTVVPPTLADEFLHSDSKSIVADVMHQSAELQESIEPIHLGGKPA